jgi:cytochrome b561
VAAARYKIISIIQKSRYKRNDGCKWHAGYGLRVVLRRGAPSLPADLPLWQSISAKASHYLLYALLIAMPLVGWSMLSAGGYPIILGGPIHLPKIMAHNDELYSFLRSAHTILRNAVWTGGIRDTG